MENLSIKFTSSQATKLESAGFTSLYQVVTYFPFRVQSIVPLDISFPQAGKMYSHVGKLKSIQESGKSKKFLLLEWYNLPIKTYIFSVSKYTLSTLQIGQDYQLVLTVKDGFWAVKKYSVFRPSYNQMTTKVYLEPVYERVKDISPANWLSVHKKLNPSDYLLDLRGLLPKNAILPEILDLRHIHHPESLELFEQTRQQWIAFKTYLYACLVKYSNLKSQIVMAQATNPDLTFLKEMSSDLPFQLTTSQKSVVWGLLQEMQLKDDQ